MCLDPITAIVLAGTAISAAGTIYSGISANKTAQANAKAIEQQAEVREEKGAYDLEVADREYRRQQGKVLAGIGASGISAASFYDVLADDAAEAALERKAIRFGTVADRSNLQTQANIQRQSGRAAMIGSVFSAVGTVATGYGRAVKAGSGIGSWDTTVQRGV